MYKRGRKQAAVAAAQATGSFVDNVNKPEPPEDLTEAQAKIWRGIVEGEPASLIASATSRAMLADLCRHRAASDEMSRLLNSFDTALLEEPKAQRRWEWLTKMRRLETRFAIEVAHKLRLTNQSRWSP